MIYEPHYWATSYALLPSDLYTRFPFKKYLSISDEWDTAEMKALCSRIFKYFFYLVIKDIIENLFFEWFHEKVYSSTGSGNEELSKCNRVLPKS